MENGRGNCYDSVAPSLEAIETALYRSGLAHEVDGFDRRLPRLPDAAWTESARDRAQAIERQASRWELLEDCPDGDTGPTCAVVSSGDPRARPREARREPRATLGERPAYDPDDGLVPVRFSVERVVLCNRLPCERRVSSITPASSGEDRWHPPLPRLARLV